MNKRQKKKQFKKKYGMNPAQFELMKQTAEWKEIADKTQKAWDSLTEAITDMAKRITVFWNNLMKNAALAAAIEKETERIREAQETMRMLENAREMPEHANEELLKYIGIREDIGRNKYEFYEDEINGVYFIKFIEEGEEEGNNDVDDIENTRADDIDWCGSRSADDTD